MRMLLAPITALIAAGCAGGSGSPHNGTQALTVADLQPQMNVISQLEVGGSHVDVRLVSPDGRYTLKSGDALTVTAGDDPPVDLADLTDRYGADLSIKASGTPVVIALSLQDGGDAPVSTVTMTEQLSLSHPQNGDTFSRGSDAVRLEWASDASEDPLQVAWSGNCVEDGSIDIAHTDTAATVPAGSVVHSAGGDDSCEVIFSVIRTRTGSLDPAFGGGTITHSFSSSVHLTSTP